MKKIWRFSFGFTISIFVLYFALNIFSILSTPSTVAFYPLDSGDDKSKTVADNENQCILQIPDPWDPTIPVKFFISNLTKCESKYRNLTYVKDGYVNINLDIAKENTTCQWQCLIPHKSEITYTTSSWYEITNRSLCDTLKTRCFTNENLQEPYYEDLHCQVSV